MLWTVGQCCTNIEQRGQNSMSKVEWAKLALVITFSMLSDYFHIPKWCTLLTPALYLTRLLDRSDRLICFEIIIYKCTRKCIARNTFYYNCYLQQCKLANGLKRNQKMFSKFPFYTFCNDSFNLLIKFRNPSHNGIKCCAEEGNCRRVDGSDK